MHEGQHLTALSPWPRCAPRSPDAAPAARRRWAVARVGHHHRRAGPHARPSPWPTRRRRGCSRATARSSRRPAPAT